MLVVRISEADQGASLQGVHHLEGRDQRVMERDRRDIRGGQQECTRGQPKVGAHRPTCVAGKGPLLTLVPEYKGKKDFLLGRLQGRSLGPGNTSVRDLMADKRFIGPVLRFFRSTGVGKLRRV